MSFGGRVTNRPPPIPPTLNWLVEVSPDSMSPFPFPTASLLFPPLPTPHSSLVPPACRLVETAPILG